MSVLVKNVSGQEIPAWAVMLVTGMERLPNDKIAMEVDSVSVPHDEEGNRVLLINGATPLGITGEKRYGFATIPSEQPFWVRYDTGDGTPEFGEEWGVEDGEWDLKSTSDESAFQILGLPDEDKSRVLATFIPQSNDCPNNFRVIVVGNPTTGTFDMNLTLPGGSGSVTLNWDDTAADLAAAVVGEHPHWDAAYTIDAADGPFPNNSISFQLGGELASIVVEAPTIDTITLSGGARSDVRVERACCEEAL